MNAAAVLWLTGASGAGESTLAAGVERELRSRSVHTEYLDGDVLRALSPTGYPGGARRALKHVGFFASRLEHHGVTVICALISPLRSARVRQATVPPVHRNPCPVLVIDTTGRAAGGRPDRRGVGRDDQRPDADRRV